MEFIEDMETSDCYGAPRKDGSFLNPAFTHTMCSFFPTPRLTERGSYPRAEASNRHFAGRRVDEKMSNPTGSSKNSPSDNVTRSSVLVVGTRVSFVPRARGLLSYSQSGGSMESSSSLYVEFNAISKIQCPDTSFTRYYTLDSEISLLLLLPNHRSKNASWRSPASSHDRVDILNSYTQML